MVRHKNNLVVSMSDCQRFEYEVSRQEYFSKMRIVEDKIDKIFCYLKNKRRPKKKIFIRGQEIK